MIILEIIQSKDTRKMGHFKFFQNSIILGPTIDYDLPLPLEGQDSLQIKIEDKKLILHIPQGVIVHVNKLRTSGQKTLTKEDLIQVETNQLVIKDFQKTIYTSRKEKLNENIEKIETQYSELIPILQEISAKA